MRDSGYLQNGRQASGDISESDSLSQRFDILGRYGAKSEEIRSLMQEIPEQIGVEA